MQTINYLANQFFHTYTTTKGVVMGTLKSHLPETTAKLIHMFPSWLDDRAWHAERKFGIQSDQLKKDAYPRGHIKNYIADMLAGLKLETKQDQEQASFKIITGEGEQAFTITTNSEAVYKRQKQFKRDLVGTRLKPSPNAEYTATQVERLQQFKTFIDNVKDVAHKSGKTWVTADKLWAVAGQLHQGLGIEQNYVLNTNVLVKKQAANVEPIFLAVFNGLQHSVETPMIMSIILDGLKITYVFEQFYSCFPAEVSPMDVDPSENVKFLKISTNTTVDFAALGEKPNSFLANFINHETTIQAVREDISFAVSKSVANAYARYNTLALVETFADAQDNASPAVSTSTTEQYTAQDNASPQPPVSTTAQHDTHSNELPPSNAKIPTPEPRWFTRAYDAIKANPAPWLIGGAVCLAFGTAIVVARARRPKLNVN